MRALKALAERRYKDAQANVEAMPDEPMLDLAWKQLLRGAILLEEAHLRNAEPPLKRATAVALTTGLDGQRPVDGDALRLAGLALIYLGMLFRRQDRAERAFRAHLAALRLLAEHGSAEELWEAAMNLGLDADLARAHDTAQSWHRLAIELGAWATHESERKQSIALMHLARSLTQQGQYERATDAARAAQGLWRSHDTGSADAARAEMQLAHVLVLLGESLHLCDPQKARAALDEALACLASAREALLPFGEETAADVQWCLDQCDFAQRLRASLAA